MDNQYSFSNFHVHDGNRYAYSIADLVAKHPGDDLTNPLTIYGPSGCGKTHLLMAIANKLRRENKEVLYLTGHTFCDLICTAFKTDPPFQYISSEETSLRLECFRDCFGNNAQVVIFDRMEILEDRPCTAVELARIAMTLMEKRKQLVFGYNTAPENIFPGFHPLTSLVRSNGMVLEIQNSEEDSN